MTRTGRMMAVAVAFVLLLGLVPAKSNADVYFAGAYGLPGLDWQRINPLPVSESLYAAAYGNGTWLAVSDHHIYRSTDGDNWDVAAPLVTQAQVQIRAFFAGGRFLVTDGKDGLVSADGRDWTAAPELTEIAQGEHGCIGIAGGKAVFAADCATWQDAGMKEPVGRVFAAGGKYFAAGQWSDRLFASDGGTTWNEQKPGPYYHPDHMAYIGGQYVLYLRNGELAVSPDGVTWGAWQSVNDGGRDSIMGMVQDASGLLLLRRDGAIAHSADGVHWEQSAQLVGHTWWAVAAGGGQTMLVGAGGAIAHSADGRTWTQVTAGLTHPWSAVVFGQGRFVALGGIYASSTYLLYSSEDGVNWTLQRMAYDHRNKAGRLAFAGGRFILFGQEGVLLVSADGLRWEAPTGPLATGRVLSDVGPLILADQSGLQVSSDGVEFRTLKAPGFDVRGAVSAGGRYVLVGGRQVATSTDGENWATATVDARDSLLGVTAGNGRYVAFGVPGEVMTSADGLAWAKVPDLRVYRVQYAGDQFVGLSGADTARSADGLTWTHTYQEPQVGGIAFGNGRHVAVGADGLIMVDGPAVAAAPPAPGADPVLSSIAVDAAENVGQPFMITVTLRDGAGRPLAGRPVLLYVPWDMGDQQVLRSDERGEARFRYAFHPQEHAVTYRAQDVLSSRWLATTVSTTPRKCGARFTDVAATDEYCQTIEAAVVRGALSGYPDGTFRGEKPLTRAELAKVALLVVGGTAQPGGPLPFTDVAGHWAARSGYIQGAAALGLMKGDPDGAFRPDAPVSRAELIKVVTALSGQAQGQWDVIYADVHQDDWFAPWAATALHYSLIGTRTRSTVYPETEGLAGSRQATRLDVACMLNNLYQLRFNLAKPTSYQ